MDDILGSKERYSVLIEGDLHEDGFLDETEKEAKNCGDVTVTFVSQSELSIEGENGALMKLFVWLLSGSFLKKVRYLKPASG